MWSNWLMLWTLTKLQFPPLCTGWHWSLPVCIVLNHVPSVAGSIKSLCVGPAFFIDLNISEKPTLDIWSGSGSDKLNNGRLQHFCQWQGNLRCSSRKCMVLTNGTLLEREMKKLSSDTRFSANDEVTTERWSLNHQIPNFYQISFFLCMCVRQLCNNDI